MKSKITISFRVSYPCLPLAYPILSCGCFEFANFNEVTWKVLRAWVEALYWISSYRAFRVMRLPTRLLRVKRNLRSRIAVSNTLSLSPRGRVLPVIKAFALLPFHPNRNPISELKADFYHSPVRSFTWNATWLESFAIKFLSQKKNLYLKSEFIKSETYSLKSAKSQRKIDK